MTAKGSITLVLGGARSGKSAFALGLAAATPGRKAYVATAQALDDEMRERIERHKRERASDWMTFEEPREIGRLISRIAKDYEVILVDCLTLWLTNLMLAGTDYEEEAGHLVASLSSCRAELVLVANEVGLGIVPENALARRFRDAAGTLNQRIAAQADKVFFIAAGLPLMLKGAHCKLLGDKS